MSLRKPASSSLARERLAFDPRSYCFESPQEDRLEGSGSDWLASEAYSGLSNYIWAFRDSEEIGPKMLSRIAKHTGLKPEDL
jgi:hypothetical protein